MSSLYSFDGEFRRLPQQNLGGASKVEEREALIRRAHLERLKREEQRKKLHCTRLIQALFKSYLVRKHQKKSQREEFDALLASSAKAPSFELLGWLSAKLLFFHSAAVDGARLIAVLQMLLKEQSAVLNAALNPGSPWLWRLRRLLFLSLSQCASCGPRDLMAIPLRVVEVYTSLDIAKKSLGELLAVKHLCSTYIYLFSKGYMQCIRTLLDSKTPPLLNKSPIPQTYLSESLLDLVVRPLHLLSVTPNHDLQIAVVYGLCQSILCPPITEPVKLFLLPALVAMSDFPFTALVNALCYDLKGRIHMTSFLLYSLLNLDAVQLKEQPLLDRSCLLSYLQILAPLTGNISRVVQFTIQNQDDDDSDMEQDGVEHDKKIIHVSMEEVEVIEECISALNDQPRVEALLQSAESCAGDTLALQLLCQLCHNLLVSHRTAVHRFRLLYMLALKPTFLRAIWSDVLSVTQTSIFGEATPLLNVISRGCQILPEDSVKIVPLLAVFSSLYTNLIVTLHDAEFYSDDMPGANHHAMPFSLEELIPISLRLKEVCLGLVELAFPESRPLIREDYRTAVNTLNEHVVAAPTAEDTQTWAHLFKVVVALVQQLHARDLRRPFCPDGHWIAKQIVIPMERPDDFIRRRRRLRSYRPFQMFRALTREELVDGPPLSTKELRVLTILRELPFLVAFEERVKVFQSLVYQDKMTRQGEETRFLQGPIINVVLRRSHLYEDCFDKLSPENEPDMRLKMRVQLINSAGAEEAGVDGGGVFREALSELLKTAFDPNRGFFRVTNDNLLYPNPNVHLIVPDFTRHYYFIGRVLGKCLYENLLVELPLAEFFLSKLVGRHSDVGVHHLASLDPVMYRNLLYLKSFEDDVSELGLDFTVVNEELGETSVDELKPGGSNIAVTSTNRIEYIHLMADYRLNRQIRAQCNAFRQGLANVIPLEWIQMFNNKELQVLISGAEIPVNVEDLKSHTNYSGGYSPTHPTIQFFWSVVENFNDVQLRQLLKFVTSCSRPPLLGFKELDPPFCIQYAGVSERLPTAATCMNLLKLPEFETEVLLRDKLLYALQSNSGFELS